MSHEIMEHDNMVSAIETPWHGLGTVLDHYPTVDEARVASGLTWCVSKRPVIYRQDNPDGSITYETVPDQYITVRDDINYPLGIVGKNYQIYQNSDMFGFVTSFLSHVGSNLETAGSLRNGRMVWAMAQVGTTEIVRNDPINKYFLFSNSYDGSSTINVCFTNVRVVCSNTLTAALRGASNLYNIRHTQNMAEQLVQIQQVINVADTYQHKMSEALAYMAKKEVTPSQAQELVNKILKKGAITVESDGEESTRQLNTKNKIVELIDYGKGADIPGVRGTVYGVINACTEYADHYRSVRHNSSRSEDELRFESNLFGSASGWKSNAFAQAIQYAQAM